MLAACGAVVQFYAGRALDAGRLRADIGLAAGLVFTATGLACALIPGVVGVVAAAVGIGVGTGVITPIGFASLAATTPENRIGQTMGAAELGRELGDAGGPLLVAAVAATATLAAGYAALATLTALASTTVLVRRRSVSSHPEGGKGTDDSTVNLRESR